MSNKIIRKKFLGGGGKFRTLGAPDPPTVGIKTVRTNVFTLRGQLKITKCHVLNVDNEYASKVTNHPGLTRVSSIRFLLFEIKRAFVFNSTIFYLTDMFIIYFFLQNAYADKKVFKKKD